VRFFHPSDQAAAADWETIAVEGARRVEGAKTPAGLIARLREIFQPIRPVGSHLSYRCLAAAAACGQSS
jgi:hypothetical protein